MRHSDFMAQHFRTLGGNKGCLFPLPKFVFPIFGAFFFGQALWLDFMFRGWAKGLWMPGTSHGLLPALMVEGWELARTFIGRKWFHVYTWTCMHRSDTNCCVASSLGFGGISAEVDLWKSPPPDDFLVCVFAVLPDSSIHKGCGCMMSWSANPKPNSSSIVWMPWIGAIQWYVSL